ncbi:MAG: 3-methyl-2-oxobutanoate hydroxymethyltransferase [Limnobacter sp.]|nr:3-methyl-2-oxobutanoate hydroxymethyltransferase [Limnobacter sp.]
MNNSDRKPTTVPSLLAMKGHSKIAMLTCYDACFASVLDQAGVDVLLVGDSLGMVLAGMPSTLPVTLEHMQYHTRCVAAARPRALVLADLPFGSYQQSPQQAYQSAAALMAAVRTWVKLEGGAWLAPTVEFLVQRDIPVCAHLGLTPQSVHALGGYKVQGRGNTNAQALLQAAQSMETAGAAMVLFEMIPASLAQQITQTLKVPTIGIGAGPGCDGQVLVLHDMLDVYRGKKPRFVCNFMQGQPSIEQAVQSYVQAVKSGTFPAQEHTFD